MECKVPCHGAFLLLGTHVCPASFFKCWKCENNRATMEKMSASESLQMDVTEDRIGKELYHVNRFGA